MSSKAVRLKEIREHKLVTCLSNCAIVHSCEMVWLQTRLTFKLQIQAFINQLEWVNFQKVESVLKSS